MPNNSKKKGHAPAHQNSFAFRHNAKSKKTAAILAAPIEHCCRRCHEKLEWRKQYRKYKPRTVLGKCNICQKRNIRAAYHTICESCSRVSNKAQELLNDWNETNQNKPVAVDAETSEATPVAEPQSESEHQHSRVCCICVKEPALPDTEEEDDNPNEPTRRLRLRERRTLERKQQQQQSASSKRQQKDEEEGYSTDEVEQVGFGDSQSDGTSQERVRNDGIQDPFLDAVGGADKLLIGEAYQKMRLEQESVASSVV